MEDRPMSPETLAAVPPILSRIEAQLRAAVPGVTVVRLARLPGMTGLADVTDHEAGTDPFFSPEKR
jgi:hypothetical protein